MLGNCYNFAKKKILFLRNRKKNQIRKYRVSQTTCGSYNSIVATLVYISYNAKEIRCPNDLSDSSIHHLCSCTVGHLL